MWRFWRSGRPPYNRPADTLLSGDRAGGAVLGDSSHRGSREEGSGVSNFLRHFQRPARAAFDCESGPPSSLYKRTM